MEESGEHLATGEGREEVVLVTLDDRCSLVPKFVTIEQDVIDGVKVAAVGAGDIVTSVLTKMCGVCGVEGVSCYDLECSGLVGSGLSGENSVDEGVKE